MSLSADLKRFYANLDRLADGVGGARRLGDCNGQQDWPDQGVYIVLDLAEPRPSGIPGEGRVVYTGTHVGKKSRLWGRLYQHRGTQEGGGQHRSSIFRNLVGGALITRSKGALKVPSWGKKKAKITPEEKKHEKRVSKYMKDFLILWLDVPDNRAKGEDLKSNIVGLLSSTPDVARSQWLGRHSNRKKVQAYGLWNIQGPREEIKINFSDTFENYVNKTISAWESNSGNPWTREETLLTLGLYLHTTFGKIHDNNPDVINLANNIKRKPGAISHRMANFAALDPTLDRKGMTGYSNLDKEIMEQLSKNPESTIEEVTNVIEKHSLENTFSDDHETSPPPTDDSYALTKTRLSQAYFRRMILRHYNYACAITGMKVRELLVASHIVPWAHRKETRTNPQNGICLNALHDKAFDRGLLTFDDDYRVILSDSLTAKKYELFSRYAGKKITLPSKFTPSLEFIRYHREKIFQR